MSHAVSANITLRVAEAVHAGANTVVDIITNGNLTKAQTYNGIRVLQVRSMIAKRQIYRGVPAKYNLTVPIEEIRAEFAPPPRGSTHPSHGRFSASALLDTWSLPVQLPQGQARLVLRGD